MYPPSLFHSDCVISKLATSLNQITWVDICSDAVMLIVEVVFVLGPIQGHLQSNDLEGYFRLFTFA